MNFNDRSPDQTSPLTPNRSLEDARVGGSHRLKLRQPLLYLALIVLGAGGVVVGDRLVRNRPDSGVPSVPAQPLESPTSNTPAVDRPNSIAARPDPLSDNPNFIADVVQQVGDAVVRIDSQRTIASQSMRYPFGQFGDETPVPPSQQIEEGTGSGFILDANGIILTNSHVIDGADRVTVVLRDGRRFEGEVLGQDAVTDVAVVKIEATDLPTVTLGNSDQVQPGEWAIAIGNPLGLDNTVTSGIISATERSSSDVGVPDRRIGFIQTDAAINPGNSGGPLLNGYGEVIGMNTAIINGAQGLGFAVPINAARRIADQLIAEGRVQHPYLGIQMATLTPEIKREINSNSNSGFIVQEDSGILVVKVATDSPAAAAGVRAGDVLVKIGDQPVTDATTVQKAVENSEIGQALPLEVRRNGQSLTLTVKPGVLPNSTQN